MPMMVQLTAWGSPPRVRSRRPAVGAAGEVDGITSACAEQTSSRRSGSCTRGDHLRVCGADENIRRALDWDTGSPPRVRSRLVPPAAWNLRPGITSACAEQTRTCSCGSGSGRDHLRVCGADIIADRVIVVDDGSPPRVRSRHDVVHENVHEVGITSACAEQTSLSSSSSLSCGDHLRVCGADHAAADTVTSLVGSPPRVRSRLVVDCEACAGMGITSACAEQTACSASTRRAAWDHLRVCGADSCILLCSEPAEWRGIFDLRTAQGELMP